MGSTAEPAFVLNVTVNLSILSVLGVYVMLAIGLGDLSLGYPPSGSALSGSFKGFLPFHLIHSFSLISSIH